MRSIEPPEPRSCRLASKSACPRRLPPSADGAVEQARIRDAQAIVLRQPWASVPLPEAAGPSTAMITRPVKLAPMCSKARTIPETGPASVPRRRSSQLICP